MNEPNIEQQVVIECAAPKILCIAGPGSGKTQTLIWRIIRLVEEGADPGRMVVITFTNAAANELIKRLDIIKVGYVGTLHRYMLGLIDKFGRTIGLHGRITVAPDDKAILVWAMETTGYKGTMRDVEKAMIEGPDCAQIRCPSTAQLVAHRAYSEMIRTHTLTYDAILKFGLKLLRQADLGVGADYLFVDEYQDSGDDDAEIYQLLKIPSKFFVGDPDQAVYNFRGGNIRHIMAMAVKSDYSVYTLASNYRCGAQICELAQKLIEHNPGRLIKITTSATGTGGSFQTSQFASPPAEHTFVAERVRADLATGTVAVLLRYNILVDQYAKMLESYSIPVARPISDLPTDWDAALLFVGLLVNPDNDYLAKRWLSKTKGDAEANRLELLAAKSGKSLNAVSLKLVPILDLLGGYLVGSNLSQESLTRIAMIATGAPSQGLQDVLLQMHAEQWKSREIGEGVLVTTLHSAKGREFDSVILPAFEQEIIPGTSKSRSDEEERRLAFVGFTRAKSSLTITHCAKRPNLYAKFGKDLPATPSIFLTESGWA